MTIPVRGLYTASSGILYTVIGQTLYSVSSIDFSLFALGGVPGTKPVSMSDNGQDLVVVCGDGFVYNTAGVRNALVVAALVGATSVETFAQTLVRNGDSVTVLLDDGTSQTVTATDDQADGVFTFTPALTAGAGIGNVVQDLTLSFAQITDSGWYDSDRVDYIDTFLIFSRKNTATWHWSLSGMAVFDPLDFGSKSGSQDLISGVIAMQDQAWVLGNQRSTEIWVNVGAPDSTFQREPGVFIEHGCAAVYSIAKSDIAIFWLGKDPQGQSIVFMGSGYKATRISTHAIEFAIQQYPTGQDAIGYTWQLYGHTFYVLIFPSGDATWMYDLASGHWTQWSSIGSQGELKRHRSNCYAFAYGQHIVGDYENGVLYRLNPDVFTDNGSAISRIRSWPHLVADNRRVSYGQFVAALEPGRDELPEDPQIGLRYSDTAGATFGNYMLQSMGALGKFYTNVQWQRLGMGRDRVFEVSWSAPTRTALNGAFVTVEVAET